MKRKYVIHDENGKLYDVEEISEETTIDEESTEKSVNGEGDDMTLSTNEILELKKLAVVADKLISLLKVEDEEPIEKPVEDDDESEDEITTDNCEEIEEEVIDTAKPRDSKRSFGAIETSRKVQVDDSLDEDIISSTWSQRYNKQLGGNK